MTNTRPSRGRLDTFDRDGRSLSTSFGFAVARAFAGHADNTNDASTITYVRATLHEVAAALAALTEEQHPLV
jgi:hypothetical protein